jgi:hypothetical protein
MCHYRPLIDAVMNSHIGYLRDSYEIDNGNQVTLALLDQFSPQYHSFRPTCIFTAEDNNNLISALTAGVSVLKHGAVGKSKSPRD